MGRLRVVWPEEFDARLAEDQSSTSTKSVELNAVRSSAPATISFVEPFLRRKFPYCRVCGGKSLRFLRQGRQVIAMACGCCGTEWSV